MGDTLLVTALFEEHGSSFADALYPSSLGGGSASLSRSAYCKLVVSVDLSGW